jgi:predicted transposase YbfD/YdcC
MLCGCTSASAIVQWGWDHLGELTQALGFKQDQIPCVATVLSIFRLMDVETFESKLAGWAQATHKAAVEAGQLQGIALDGKALRVTSKIDPPGVHLLAALGHELGLTLDQQAVSDASTKGHEIPTALELLKRMPLEGLVVTMDALLTQREIAQAIVDRHGDYLMVVKENQPMLYEDLRVMFSEPASKLNPMDIAEEVSTGHGRIEIRRVWVSSALKGYTDWPGLEQALCLERKAVKKRTGETSVTRLYAVTSLSARRANARQLLARRRGHWRIENGLHWIRDVDLGEDQSTIRRGHAPQVMAAVRNTVIGALRAAGAANIAAALRHNAAHADEAIQLLGLRLVEN